MTLYTAVILLTELMMLSMIIHILHYSGFTAEQKRWYILTFSSIMVCTASEWAAIHFNSFCHSVYGIRMGHDSF